MLRNHLLEYVGRIGGMHCVHLINETCHLNITHTVVQVLDRELELILINRPIIVNDDNNPLSSLPHVVEQIYMTFVKEVETTDGKYFF